MNTLIPLIRACSQCEQDHGIKHTGSERITHGYCRRHAIEWLQQTGLPAAKIERTVAQLGECCPDLGPVELEVAA